MKKLFFLFILILSLKQGYAQSNEEGISLQTKLDSLKQVYFSGGSIDLEILVELIVTDPNPDSILKYGNLLLTESFKDSLHGKTSTAYIHLGQAYVAKGELSRGLESYFEGLKYSEKIGDEDTKGLFYITIANAYSANGNNQNARVYFGKGIEILRNGKDSLGLGSAIFNAGDEYLTLGKLDSALLFTNEAQKIFEIIDFPIGEAYCFGNLGMIYAENGNNLAAEQNINKAISILEEYKEYSAISFYLNYMSAIYLERGERNTAVSYADRSLKLAQEYGLKDEISDAYLTLSDIYESAGNTQEALEFYKNHILYRDSVNNLQSVQEMANLRTDYEVSQKQVEVDLLEKEALITQLETKRQQFLIYGVLFVLVIVAILAIMTYRRYRYEKETKLIIEEEKNRSEELLLNILPAETAEELKSEGKVKAKRINSATVLFTDFKSFSAFSENISPEKLVESIDFYFKEFDRISTKYGLEKIKTIGDSYMCAGGLPKENETHPKDVVLAAIEMMSFVNQTFDNNLMHFEMRIGIHTGPIVAGIVGIKKWQYDIWGDTVNIASRMETNSVAGKINLSETTYELVKDEFSFQYRGSIDVKNRGIWNMYYLET